MTISAIDIPALADFNPVNNPHVRVLPSGYTVSNCQTLFYQANKHIFGIVAVNIRHKIIIEAALEAAFKEKSPIILEIAESEAGYCDMSPARASGITHEVIQTLIEKYGYSVPVVLHMDHVQKDLSIIDLAIEAGFSSIEVDLSRLPLEENIEKCKEVVKKLHPLGISVEVEEGEIGAADALADPNIDANIEKYYTKVEDARRLVEETRPDSLAIFVGNGHGKYLKEPKIGIERLGEIAQAIKPFGVSVVLHGGTGLSIGIFNQAIEAGARKLNYATAVSDFLFDNLPQRLLDEMDKRAEEEGKPRRKVLKHFLAKIDALDPAILEKAKGEIIDHLSMMMRDAFRSTGKAELYK